MVESAIFLSHLISYAIWIAFSSQRCILAFEGCGWFNSRIWVPSNVQSPPLISIYWFKKDEFIRFFILLAWAACSRGFNCLSIIRG